MELCDYGLKNEHNVGIIMKEMVRRAIAIIRRERFIFESQKKEGYDGILNDVSTTADFVVQEMYLRTIKENFEECGIIAEENKIMIPCRHSQANVYFTVDPVCGTKAFDRRQSHGIGTMISLVLNGEVIAAYIGDVMTQVIFGFRPGSKKVWRISEYENFEKLEIDGQKLLSDQYVLLLDLPDRYSAFVQSCVKSKEQGGLFKSGTMSDGSIGLSMARLWKGEVGAVFLASRYDTPWDVTPILGISQKLNCVFLSIPSDSNSINFDYKTEVSRTVKQRIHELLVIHQDRIPELKNWIENRRD